MNEDRPNIILLTVDKSHIVTIEERLYGESVELINNAYDVDAAERCITLSKSLMKLYGQ